MAIPIPGGIVPDLSIPNIQSDLDRGLEAIQAVLDEHRLKPDWPPSRPCSPEARANRLNAECMGWTENA